MGQGRGEEGKEEVKRATFPTLLTMIVAAIPEYNQPLAASYYQQPPAFVDDPFPALEELPSLSFPYLSEERQNLIKTIKGGEEGKEEVKRATFPSLLTMIVGE